jgi:beta-galactosidase
MFSISGDQFLLNDKPFRILSGAIHYFRIVPEYWRDRLEKARAFGLNTVETYVAWTNRAPVNSTSTAGWTSSASSKPPRNLA